MFQSEMLGKTFLDGVDSDCCNLSAMNMNFPKLELLSEDHTENFRI